MKWQGRQTGEGKPRQGGRLGKQGQVKKSG
jgi:hypothetical protein